METTITKRMTGKQMKQIFNDGKINIRWFQAKNFDESKSENEMFTYDLTIRHNEDEEAEKLLADQLKRLK